MFPNCVAEVFAKVFRLEFCVCVSDKVVVVQEDDDCVNSTFGFKASNE